MVCRPAQSCGHEGLQPSAAAAANALHRPGYIVSKARLTWNLLQTPGRAANMQLDDIQEPNGLIVPGGVCVCVGRR
jgi:hypothetical protein